MAIEGHATGRWRSIGNRSPPLALEKRASTMNIRWSTSVGLIAAVVTVPALALAWVGSVPARARAAAVPQGDAEDKIRDSVVKIFATLRQPDLSRPWTKHSPSEASGRSE